MKPLFKAAGGKTKLLPEIERRIPSFVGHYYEPFLGGGAVFATLATASLAKGKSLDGWVICDSNMELMNAYRVCRDDCSGLIAGLQAIRHSKEGYYAIRAREETTELGRAIRFAYLNRTAFNGLWRVNAQGKFNVPIGSYKNPTLVDPENFSRWSRVLQSGAEILHGDFEAVITSAKAGDFIYADPPYLPRSKTANFDGYTAGGFTQKDHERLASSLVLADKRGVSFLCSQGDGPIVRSMYRLFTIESVSVRHSVGAKASSRSNVAEVLISNMR